MVKELSLNKSRLGSFVCWIIACASSNTIAGTVNRHVDATYYCSRTNGELYFVENVQIAFSSFFSDQANYDHSSRLRASNPTSQFSVLEVSDCSNSEFLCLELSDRFGKSPYLLAIPRNISKFGVYKYRGLEIVISQNIQESHPWIFDPEKTSNDVSEIAKSAYVVILYPAKTKKAPIYLTLKDGFGIETIDGLVSSYVSFPTFVKTSKFSNGMCSFVNGRAIFSKVSVNIPQP